MINHIPSQYINYNQEISCYLPAQYHPSQQPYIVHALSPKTQDFSEILTIYNPNYAPKANRDNLQNYYSSTDFQRHAATARIYYNAEQLAPTDALSIIFQREPTNISMGSDQYDVNELYRLFGYKQGIYIDPTAKKADGSLFFELPNTACVYSETYQWDPPGGDQKKEIACLSLPAPALDSTPQPHYQYYMSTGALDAEKYQNEMAFLFKCIENAVRDNKDAAFNGKGLKRVVLSKFGQGAFLSALPQADRDLANHIYKRQLAVFLNNMQDIDIEIVLSATSQPNPLDMWHKNIIVGDISKTSKEGDLIINAWDPHSAPGNGNDADRSFDGAMGKSSGILLTQTAWFNPTLTTAQSLRPCLR